MCCNVSNKYRKFKKTKIYIKKNTLSISIVYTKCGHECEKIFQEEESIEILKTLGLINNIEEYQKYIIMPQENVNQEFRLKTIDEIRNYLTEKINQNELMSKKHKKVFRVLNYIDNFHDYWMHFYFCFRFFSWCSYTNYKSIIKN